MRSKFEFRLDRSLWLPIGVVIALFVFFSLTSSAFPTVRNLTILSAQASTLLIVCIGATFVVLMGSIDLSVGAVVLLVGALSVKIQNGTGIGAAIVLLAAVLGGVLGLINGIIYAYGAVPSFVVTLGSLSIFNGLGLQILQGRAISFNSEALDAIAIGQWVPPIQNITLCAIAIWGLGVLIAQRTRFGRYMYLIGGGESVARNSGIPVRRYKLYAFTLSGLIAGFGGILSVARLGAAGPTLGQELLLNSLAAIVVGGTSLSGGVGGPHRSLLGVLIISILDNGLNLLGVTAYPQLVIKGVVVITAVLVSQARRQGILIK
ncbi:MAG: ABC transporter permease [Verrucomicrobia bacterium]|nr:ABC transporter permease [Verrucomicrobiota bacterium]MBV9671234.1 ABC transporter permease [Verrucomicrobiota bacterium]